jgi:hypothetical protein
MKKLFTTILFLSMMVLVLAQPPERISFQAVVRNADGELLKSTPVGFRIQVLMTNEFGAAVFVETQLVTTNVNGLAILQIGNGTAVTGKLEDIDWSKGPYFLKTEVDPDGGTNYTLTGTEQILSVPYALYARNAGLPEGIVRSNSVPNAGDLLFYDGSGWKPVPAGTEGQVLTIKDGVPAWKTPLTGYEIIGLHEPVLYTAFRDASYNHTMHIATDGYYYYTCNGGNYTLGRINKFTMAGDSVGSFPIALDMRGLMYNKADGSLYVSGFEAGGIASIYKITSLENGTFVNKIPNAYDYYQSTTAISDDGEFYYAFYNGVLKQYKLSDGSLVNTFENIESGNTSGSNGAVAVDDKYFYTWDPASKIIHVYNLDDGSFEKNLKISSGSYGYSLSYADGYLFVSDDANYRTGRWYGYNIRKMINPTKIITAEAKIQSSESRVIDGTDTTVK